MKSVKLQLLVTLAAVIVSAGFFAARGLPPFTKNLYKATYEDDLVALRFALSCGANVNEEVGPTDWTPLDAAATWDRRDAAELLIAYGANVNARDRLGDTPLHDAAQWGHKDMAELLLVHGAEVNARGLGYRTPLHRTSEHIKGFNVPGGGDDTPNEDLRDVAELLIAHGADINAKDAEGKTSLQLAVEDRNKEVADLLRQHGAKE